MINTHSSHGSVRGRTKSGLLVFCQNKNKARTYRQPPSPTLSLPRLLRVGTQKSGDTRHKAQFHSTAIGDKNPVRLPSLGRTGRGGPNNRGGCERPLPLPALTLGAWSGWWAVRWACLGDQPGAAPRVAPHPAPRTTRGGAAAAGRPAPLSRLHAQDRSGRERRQQADPSQRPGSARVAAGRDTARAGAARAANNGDAGADSYTSELMTATNRARDGGGRRTQACRR